MPKYRSIKEKGKNGPGTQITSNQYLFFNPISFILVIIGIMGEAYITVKYWGKDPYANYSLLLLSLGVGALLLLIWLNPQLFSKFSNKYLNTRKHKTLDIENYIVYIVLVTSLIFSIAIIWAVMRLTIRFALTSQDLYFYYISTAIIEELVFRMALMGVIKAKTTWGNIAAVLINAFSFMGAHYEYYGENTADMLSILFAGVVLGLYFSYTEDISITMIGHMFINIIAVGNILMSTGGV